MLLFNILNLQILYFYYLGRNCPGLHATVIHDVTVKLLDVVYIERDVIYKLLGNATGAEIDIKLINDNFLLATSIIVAAAYIVDTESSDSVSHFHHQQSEVKITFNIHLI